MKKYLMLGCTMCGRVAQGPMIIWLSKKERKEYEAIKRRKKKRGNEVMRAVLYTCFICFVLFFCSLIFEAFPVSYFLVLCVIAVFALFYYFPYRYKRKEMAFLRERRKIFLRRCNIRKGSSFLILAKEGKRECFLERGGKQWAVENYYSVTTIPIR